MGTGAAAAPQRWLRTRALQPAPVVGRWRQSVGASSAGTNRCVRRRRTGRLASALCMLCAVQRNLAP
jgi:hypothetical protein